MINEEHLNPYQSKELIGVLEEIKEKDEGVKKLKEKIGVTAKKTGKILNELPEDSKKVIQEYEDLNNQMYGHDINLAFMCGMKFLDGLEEELRGIPSIYQSNKDEIISRYFDCKELQSKVLDIVAELKKLDEITNTQYLILEEYANISLNTILMMLNIIDM